MPTYTTGTQTPGETAYNAYGDKREWRSVTGDNLPPFKEQSNDLREAWEAAARAVLRKHSSD